jgi:di/tricarboxylate transporter
MNQRTWRTIGGVCITGCAIMAWCGADFFNPPRSPAFLAGYWGVFIVLLIAAFYMVLLDVRFIRLQYHLGQRELFHETLGEEGLRKTLRDAEQQQPGPDIR